MTTTANYKAQRRPKPMHPETNPENIREHAQLTPGRYWMTFRVGTTTQRRRVLLALDSVGQLRSLWATEHWVRYPPLTADDIGLLASNMHEDTRFEAVPVETRLETDEQSQASVSTHKDVYGQPLRPGSYFIGFDNEEVTSAYAAEIFEDELTGDLCLRAMVRGKETVQRIDELAGGTTFIPRT